MLKSFKMSSYRTLLFVFFYFISCMHFIIFLKKCIHISDCLRKWCTDVSVYARYRYTYPYLCCIEKNACLLGCSSNYNSCVISQTYLLSSLLLTQLCFFVEYQNSLENLKPTDHRRAFILISSFIFCVYLIFLPVGVGIVIYFLAWHCTNIEILVIQMLFKPLFCRYQ
jgi:hypothetical protein